MTSSWSIFIQLVTFNLRHCVVLFQSQIKQWIYQKCNFIRTCLKTWYSYFLSIQLPSEIQKMLHASMLQAPTNSRSLLPPPISRLQKGDINKCDVHCADRHFLARTFGMLSFTCTFYSLLPLFCLPSPIPTCLHTVWFVIQSCLEFCTTDMV